MKRLLIISVALNAILLAALLSRTRATNNTTEPQTPTPIAKIIIPLPPQPPPPTHAKSTDINSWLPDLRAAGVPNKILANVVIADFENRWDARERNLQKQFDAGDLDASAITRAEDERVAEREQTLRNALGEEGFREWDKENTLRDLNLDNLNLSAAETDSLYQLRKTLMQTQRDLQTASHEGKIDDADLSRKLSALQTQYDTQVHALLGDDRYAQMNVSPDPTTADLRRKTINLHPTDDELTALTAAQKQWNDQRAALDHQLESAQITPEQHDAQMQALDSARDQACQRALGANTFAQFERSQDPNYQAMKHFSTAWQLTDDDIDYLYSTLQYYKTSVASYQQQLQTLQNQGQPVDWTNVQKSISQFSGQIDQTLQNYLGDERFKKLEQNNILTLGN